jgi:hypothetical protein
MVTIWQSRRGIKSEAEMQEQVIGLKATIGQLKSEVAEQGRVNAELAKESIGAVTGGDSFCWMQVNHQFGYPTPIFVHSGKHPWYDVDIRITDLQKLRSGIQPSDVALRVPELNPGRAYMNPKACLPFSDDQGQDFNIFFSARNGMWVEKLRLRKKEGEWTSACQVWITNPTAAAPREPMFEEISAGYPRAEDGTVDWGV